MHISEQAWHKKQLQGLVVLQVDEVINIAAPAKHRYSKAVLLLPSFVCTCQKKSTAGMMRLQTRDASG